MTDAKQSVAGEKAGSAQADESESPLGRLPAGIIDETPLETYDEETFLKSLAEDDDRPRFGTMPDADESALGLVVGNDDPAPMMAEPDSGTAGDGAVGEAVETVGGGDDLVVDAMMAEPAVETASSGDDLVVDAMMAEQAVETASSGDDLGLDAIMAEPAVETVGSGDDLGLDAMMAEPAVETVGSGDDLGPDAMMAEPAVETVGSGDYLGPDAIMAEPAVETVGSGDDLGLDAIMAEPAVETASSGDDLMVDTMMAELDAGTIADTLERVEPAALEAELETVELDALEDAATDSGGFDLGLDEIDLAAIEQVESDADTGDALAPGGQDAAKSFDLDLDDKPAKATAAGPKLPKFMFDVSFDLPDVSREAKPPPEPEPEIPPEPEVPPPPTFSEEELAAARQAGFADGQAAGYHEAMQSLESKTSQGIDAVGMFLPTLLSERDKLATILANDAARLAHALVRRALPELNRRYGVAEIEAVVRQSVQTALDQPRILVRVAPEIAEKLIAPIEATAQTAGFTGRVTVIGDPALGPADVRLDWGDGGVERMAEQVWADLTAIVARMVEGLESDVRLGSVAKIESAA